MRIAFAVHAVQAAEQGERLTSLTPGAPRVTSAAKPLCGKLATRRASGHWQTRWTFKCSHKESRETSYTTVTMTVCEPGPCLGMADKALVITGTGCACKRVGREEFALELDVSLLSCLLQAAEFHSHQKYWRLPVHSIQRVGSDCGVVLTLCEIQ